MTAGWLAEGLALPLRAVALALAVLTVASLFTGQLTPRTPLQDMEKTYPVLNGLLNPDPAGSRIRKAPSGTALLSVFAGRWLAGTRIRDVWDTSPEYGSPYRQSLWEAGRLIELGDSGFGPWEVPDQPTWLEDPFGSQPWREAYLSLVWVKAPASAYFETKDEQDAEDVRHYVMSWITRTQQDAPPEAWMEGVVSLRTDTLIDLFDKVLAETLAGDDLAEFIALLHGHGMWLSDRIGQNASLDRLMLDRAVSLFQLSARISEFAEARSWRAQARTAISAVVTNLISRNPAYISEDDREMAAELVLRVHPFLAQFGQGLGFEELTALEHVAN